MKKTVEFVDEPIPGRDWCAQFQRDWPGARQWYLKEGEAARPSLQECDSAFDRHMPELKPMWQRLCGLVGGGDLESRLLSCWSPPNVFSGCSVAVAEDEAGPVLVRNYDFDPAETGESVVRSRWTRHGVIGWTEGSWGLLDGMNDAGLAACLTFGGRSVCGPGFSVVLVLRYVLETCATAAEAAETLASLRTPISQNLVVLDVSGDHFTAVMAPDHATRFWKTNVTTNHSERSTEAAAPGETHSAERFGYLERHLDRSDLIERFFAAPIYNTDYDGGFGTVYTAIYRPAQGHVTYRWPERAVTQSFEHFTPQRLTVHFRQGHPAAA